MSEIGEMYKERREVSRIKKVQSVKASLRLLKARGFKYKLINQDLHAVIVYKGSTIDFWPSTGLWRYRNTSKKGRGVFELLKDLGGFAKR